MEKTRGYRHRFGIAFKVDAIIAGVLLLGLGLVFGFFVTTLVSTRARLNETALLAEADLIYTAIENFMLPGEAPIAVRFMAEIERNSEGTEFRLWRRMGVPAFSDNETIRTVNANLHKNKFAQRPGAEAPTGLLPPLRFDEAVNLPPSDVSYRERSGDRTWFRVYRPLINLPKCTGCHGSDHTVRGVIDLRTDISAVERSEFIIIAAGISGFAILALVLAAVMGAFIRKVVVNPVKAIGKLCLEVSGGSFEGRVSVSGRDEIGELSATVNDMVKGLRERYELTKYVSAGTIGAIGGKQESRRIEATVFFSDVRGFTSYSSDHDPEAVVAVLNGLLQTQTTIILAEGGDIDKFVGDEVVAVFSGSAATERACKAGLAIQDRLAACGDEFDGLKVGIGIARGPLIQGMVGSSARADFTVIGDTVNMGARLCSLARPGQVILSEAAKLDAKAFAYRGPASAKVKGKGEPQRVWLLVGKRASG